VNVIIVDILEKIVLFSGGAFYAGVVIVATITAIQVLLKKNAKTL
jgi:hypothetical protein